MVILLNSVVYLVNRSGWQMVRLWHRHLGPRSSCLLLGCMLKWTEQMEVDLSLSWPTFPRRSSLMMTTRSPLIC